jgi:hypothetical protein
MRKLILFAVLAALIACNSETEKTGSMGSSSKSNGIDSATVASYPTKPTYEGQAEIGDPKHAITILNLWKNWDSGDLQAAKDHFADSVTIIVSDGTTMSGPRDSVLKSVQSFRDMFASIKSEVEVVLPVRGTSKNENWVSIWGKEVMTDKQGKMDSSFIHEAWRLNENGKVNYMMQYTRRPSPAQN